MAHKDIIDISRIARNHEDLIRKFVDDANEAESLIVLEVPGRWEWDVILPVGMTYTFHGATEDSPIEMRRLSGLMAEMHGDAVKLTGVEGTFLRVGQNVKIDMSSGYRKEGVR